MRIHGINIYKARKSDSDEVNQLRNILSAMENLRIQLFGPEFRPHSESVCRYMKLISMEIKRLRKKK